MTDRIVSDAETVSFGEGLETLHGHRGHRSKYPDTPGPPPMPVATRRTSAAAPRDQIRPSLRRQVL